ARGRAAQRTAAAGKPGGMARRQVAVTFELACADAHRLLRDAWNSVPVLALHINLACDQCRIWVSVVKTFGTFSGEIERRIWRIFEWMLSGLAAMVKTSILNRLSFDPFSFKQDGLASSEVDIGRSEIGDALVVSKMIIVSDEVAD